MQHPQVIWHKHHHWVFFSQWQPVVGRVINNKALFAGW